MKKLLVVSLMIVLAMAVGTAGCAKKTTEEKATECIDHLARHLDLTDLQRSKLEIIRNDILNRRSEMLRQTMDQTRFELISQLHREKFEPAEYVEFKNKSLKHYDYFYLYLGQKLEEFHSLLSPPQREKLVQEIERNRDSWFTN